MANDGDDISGWERLLILMPFSCYLSSGDPNPGFSNTPRLISRGKRRLGAYSLL